MMWLLCSLLLCAVCAQGNVKRAQAAAAVWPMIGGNIQHTGQATNAGPGNNVTLLWRSSTATSCAVSSFAIDSAGTLYYSCFRSGANVLLAINGSNGVQIWEWQPPNRCYHPVTSTPALFDANRTVYVGMCDGKLHAVDMDAGVSRWMFASGSYKNMSSAVIFDVASYTVYAGSQDGMFYAVNAHDGSLRWSFNTGSEYQHTATVYGGVVFLSAEGNLFALNATNGAFMWVSSHASWSQPIIGNHRGTPTLYITASGMLYAVSPVNGTKSRLGDLNCDVQPAVSDSNDTVYCVGESFFYALDGVSGNRIWTAYVGNNIKATVIGVDGIGYAVDGQTGEVSAVQGVRKWVYPLHDPIIAPPAIGLYGILYVNTKSGAVFALQSLPYVAPMPLWQLRSRNASRSGLSDYIGPTAVTVAWQIPSSGVARDASPVIDSDGITYVVVDGGNTLLRIIGSTPERCYSPQTVFTTSPALSTDSSLAYVGGSDGVFYAIFTENCTLAWSFKTKGTIASAAGVGVDGTVYFGSDEGALYALNGTTGEQVWRYVTGSPVQTPPAVDEHQVYIGANDSLVYALRVADGELVWTFRTQGPVIASPTLAGATRLYVASTDGYLYTLGTSGGSLLWKFLSGGPIVSSPCVLEGVGVAIGSSDGNMYALHETDGAYRWSIDVGAPISASPTIDSSAVLFFGSEAGVLYAVDMKTGTERFRCEGALGSGSSMAVPANHALIFGASDGTVIKLTQGSTRHRMETFTETTD